MSDMKKKPPEGYEDIYIDRGAENDEPTVQVGVNGKLWNLPKGQTSRVPVYVADEIRRSRRAQGIRDKNIDRLLAASKIPEGSV